MPGFQATSGPFHPLFLDRLRPFAALRFMDWGRTNNNPVKRWADRTTPTYRSQAGSKGVAWEWMLDLANTLGKDPWLCVPHGVDDDYVQHLAALVRDRLSPGLKVHVEYSNEVWNGQFQQCAAVAAAGRAAGRNLWQQYAARATQIFRIFEATLGRGRLVRVLAGQSNNIGVAKQILAATPPGAADAMAIAPYFGGVLGNKLAAQARGMSVGQLLDACVQDVEVKRAEVRAHLSLTRQAGVQLVAYEGGQHLVGVGSNVNDANLVGKFIDANRAARMGQVYRDYLAMWRTEVGTTFCAFNDCYVPQKWGCWGALEYQDQVNAPKYSALVDVANQWRAGN
jgi:hypothetical protein